ncbi:MAG: hypothetical protein PWR01_4358 [Clostridiales bacterium]|jgi:hypothetical protein|nr:hypothetical protein [Clostridiales bacterium]MDN5283285.1 hypothetical protein [Candidatus Ozemobacter sp.]
MKALLTSWTGRFISLIVLTIAMAVGGYLVDPAYFQNPLGEGEIGLLAKDGYSMPATTEISVVADGVDPLQVDLTSVEGDFSGELEVIDPSGSIIFSDKFALRHHPKSFLPNPSKWQTFYSPTTGKGEYLLRLTQQNPGKARVFFYQGPFVVRMLMLPLIAAFFLLVIVLTLSPSKNEAAKTPEAETA